MKKGINILARVVLLVSAGVFLLSIIFHLTGIYINTTPSFPVGFYKIVDEPAGRGAYVSFCPPYRSGASKIMLTAQQMRTLPDFFNDIPDPR
jgi:type IV secretory pathway protease TraF